MPKENEMGNIFNDDFIEFIGFLNIHQVEYILVGGYSVILHGYPRTTGDLDIWVDPTSENYKKLKIAFLEFGLPIMPENEFLSSDSDVFTYGRPPHAIDLMTQCKGLVFGEAYSKSEIRELDEITLRIISYDDLVTAKKSSGRNKDLNDLDHL